MLSDGLELERAVEVTRLLLERLGTSEGVDDEARLGDRARILNNLAVRLSELGRREEALAKAEEAVRIREGLAKARHSECAAQGTRAPACSLGCRHLSPS